MVVPDDATESRVMRVIHPHHTAKRRLPENGPAGVHAQITGLNFVTHANLLRFSTKDYTEEQISQAASAKNLLFHGQPEKTNKNQSSTRSIPPVFALPT
jgi:hypothetical protein